MILIPYPSSKKNIKAYEKDVKLFFRIFPKIFSVIDVVAVLAVSIILTLFVGELKTSNVLEFGGLIVGIQFQSNFS